MRKKAGIGVGLLLGGLVCLGGAMPVGAANDLKLGYVDMAKVFDGYEKTKASDATLRKKGQQKQAEIEGKVGELRKIREGLDLLSGEERERRAQQLEERADSLKRFRNGAARDLTRERNVIAQGILKDIEGAVQEYAKSNGFSMVLDQRTVLYGQGGGADVTNGVLQLLNNRYAKPQQPSKPKS